MVLEEADESLYWLEVSQEAELLAPSEQLNSLLKEANEIVSIFNAADITAKRKRDEQNPNINKSQNQK